MLINYWLSGMILQVVGFKFPAPFSWHRMRSSTMSWFSRFSLRNSRKYPPPSEEVLVLLSSFICTAMWGWWDFRMPHILMSVCPCDQAALREMFKLLHYVWLPTFECLFAVLNWKMPDCQRFVRRGCVQETMSWVCHPQIWFYLLETPDVFCLMLPILLFSDEVIYNWINGNRRDSPIWQRGFLTDRNSEIFGAPQMVAFLDARPRLVVDRSWLSFGTKREQIRTKNISLKVSLEKAMVVSKVLWNQWLIFRRAIR